MDSEPTWHGDRPKEECGVVGLCVPGQDAARLAFFSLFALQHRGQESAGIAVGDGHQVHMHKNMGLVSQVFDEDALHSMPGSVAIGHTRYSTAGASVLRNAQPIFCTSSVGDVAVAHNGNLVNAYALRREMEAEGERFDSTADSELIARLFVRALDRGPMVAVREVMRRTVGAYSVCVLTPNGVVGFRDPNGVRPLVYGTLSNGWLLASETCAFWPVGGTPVREVEPGEAVLLDEDGAHPERIIEGQPERLCLFETIYFARPDSVMHGTTLYSARERMGEALAREHPVEADIVVPVPDSGIPAAHGYSRESGIRFHEVMMKSRYIHRTFIQPDQRMREMGVRMKLAPLQDEIRGNSVILVDDSIVRATTTGQIVRLMRESGATEVHVRITAPPIQWPCFYGIDMASKEELAAARMTIDEICSHIGADTLGYLSIEGATSAVGPQVDRYCLACFNGKYPIPIPSSVRRDPFADDPDVVGQMATLEVHQGSLFQD
ncbi:MAG: amidophosphoribosyltransferase [Fimbriimonadaceae bacterium]